EKEDTSQIPELIVIRLIAVGLLRVAREILILAKQAINVVVAYSDHQWHLGIRHCVQRVLFGLKYFPRGKKVNRITGFFCGDNAEAAVSRKHSRSGCLVVEQIIGPTMLSYEICTKGTQVVQQD